MNRHQVEKNPVMGLSWQELIKGSLLRLHPGHLYRQPVMLVVGLGIVISALFSMQHLLQGQSWGLEFSITLILLFTLLFANAAETLAEARGKAQASSLKAARDDLKALRQTPQGALEYVAASQLRRGDVIQVKAQEIIPADGEIIQGAATINESAITGESAPVIREAGTDNSGVSAGTKVLTNSILVRVSHDPGSSLLDRMIALVEGAQRQKTPNELALSVLISALTLIFLLVVVSLMPIGHYLGISLSIPVLVALLVCLIPTTIGALLPAIGIAGMDRALKANLIAKSGKAVEIAGSVDVLLLDKTGTITLGDRHANEMLPLGVSKQVFYEAAYLSSLADPTPEGKSIVEFIEQEGVRIEATQEAQFIEFSAETRMSGVDLADGRSIRKGAVDAVSRWVKKQGGHLPSFMEEEVERIARSGATPLAVAIDDQLVGVIALADIIKSGIQERFAKLRLLGIKTIMVTGDNPLTAAAIAAEAGVDDFIAEATPEKKLQVIRDHQQQGQLVAMVGDGTNDAPALAQADLGLAMNSGTQAAREAGNLVDLDSNPGKLLDVVEIGKQLLVTRGALTTFSLTNDVAKYFVLLPALFAASFPALAGLDILNLSSPENAILAAVIFNALIIPALVPLALKGVRVKALKTDQLFRNNLIYFGLGGLILPFIAIKCIDLILAAVI
ncbi:potassium-transporting ATPase subunit KdpB [Marinospirillum sp. MEB164]|uniref:Potassium-transporting ATPase ATP-binding subunit n=1 Tax=Marinospirillum alkalitolerans TaxID=3123374 RepID=A0ABW8PXZ9_9GAMM